MHDAREAPGVWLQASSDLINDMAMAPISNYDSLVDDRPYDDDDDDDDDDEDDDVRLTMMP